MKRMMKKFSLLLLVALLVSALTTTAFAAGPTVTYTRNNGTFTFGPGSSHSPTDLFEGFKGVMPGDSLTEQITIRNNADRNVYVDIYMRARGAAEGSEDFLSQLTLTVAQHGRETRLFEAAANRTAQLSDWVLLGTFQSSGKTTLDLTLNVPITMGNEFQDAVGILEWEFRADEHSTPGVSATAVEIVGAPKAMGIGDSVQLSAKVSPADCTEKPVWSSSDPSIATVDENGKVTAHKTGTVTITVTVGNVSDSVEIKVGLFPIDLSGSDLVGPGSIVEVDGSSYQLDENSIAWVKEKTHRIVVTYKYGKSATVDPIATYTNEHQTYPSNMYVWHLTFSNGEYSAERIGELDNFLTYKGTSIRMTGNQGIRIFTAVNSANREKLIQGRLMGSNALHGYRLVEYGTLFQWLNTERPLVYDANRNNRSIAYSAATGYDAVFSQQGADIWFTGMLVNLQLDRCDDELVLRPYMILEKDGEQIVIHGGTLQRSIGYVAYQNKDYKPTQAAHDFIWNILYTVYGKDFKG